MKKSVNTIIQNKVGKYLLQIRDGTEGICNPLKWNFFGGNINDGEDPLAAAVREIGEELVITAEPSDFELLGELHPDKSQLVYVIRYKKPLTWQNISIREGAGAGFFTNDELLHIDITKTTRKIIEQYLADPRNSSIPL